MLPLYAVRSRCQAESSVFFPLGQLQLQPQLPASSSISSGDIGLQASSAPNTAFHIGQSSLGSDTPHIGGHGAPLRGVIVVGQPSLSMQSNIITSCNPWYALRSKCQALLCPCRGQPYANRQTAWKRGYLTVSAGCRLGLPTCGRFRHRPSGVRGQRPRKRSAAGAGHPTPRKNQRSNKERRERRQTNTTTNKERLREREGIISRTIFAPFLHAKLCTAQSGKNSNNPS